MLTELSSEGFAIVNDVLSRNEVNDLLQAVSSVETTNPTFRKSADLFAIRQFFNEVPAALEILAGSKLSTLIDREFGGEYFIVKSIYFDKPPGSNWFVSYHQDLTISVDRKTDLEGFSGWTVKQNQFAVRPPLEILKDNFTVRIHLDDTNKDNGALRVLSGSHLKGILRTEDIEDGTFPEVDCEIEKGGAMFMKPLLLHSSGRATNGNRRRVVHIEYSRKALPSPLNWAERPILRAHIRSTAVRRPI